MNVLIAFVLLVGLLTVQGLPTGTTSRVDAIDTKAPAAQALQLGDRIVAVDGRRGDPAVLRHQINTHRCTGALTQGCQASTPADVTIVRNGQERTVTITPRYDTQVKRMLLGFQFGASYEALPLGRAMSRSVTYMWDVSTLTVDRVTALFYDSQARKQVSGVVGSYETTRQSFAADDMYRAVLILALISLSLAIINLFPFLPLDGGHIFWALAEKVRGRPISFRVLEQASVVGFALVMVLFAIGLTNDIGHLSDGSFKVR
jgi:regulator of sigma E protease